MSAERPEVGDPFMGTQVHAASSSQSWASLRALLPDSPQEVRDVCTPEDRAQVLDPEAEDYANVGASISLPDLAVGATTNVGATLGLGQTTRHTHSSKSSIGIGRALGVNRHQPPMGSPYRRLSPVSPAFQFSELPEYMGHRWGTAHPQTPPLLGRGTHPPQTLPIQHLWCLNCAPLVWPLRFR